MAPCHGAITASIRKGYPARVDRWVNSWQDCRICHQNGTKEVILDGHCDDLEHSVG